eukprot:gene12138-12276_t
MALTRSGRRAERKPVPKSEYIASEADSTAARWPSPPPAPKRKCPFDPVAYVDGVQWQDGLPEGCLSRVFELLLADKNATEAPAVTSLIETGNARSQQWQAAQTQVQRPLQPGAAVPEQLRAAGPQNPPRAAPVQVRGSKIRSCPVVVWGAGSDSTWFNLQLQDWELLPAVRYIEVDHPEEHYCLALGVVGDGSGAAAAGWLGQGLRLELLKQLGSRHC